MKKILLALAVSLCLTAAASAADSGTRFSGSAGATPTTNFEEAPPSNAERRAELQKALDQAQQEEAADRNDTTTDSAVKEKKATIRAHKVNKIKSELLNTPIN